jgi:hypothetical protein
MPAKKKTAKKTKKQRGGSFLDKLINSGKLPEMHFRGFDSGFKPYSFAGPFTKLDKRIDSKTKEPLANSKPVNRVDKAAYYHDLAYENMKDHESRKHADNAMIDDLDMIRKDKKARWQERADATIVGLFMKGKRLLGLGKKKQKGGMFNNTTQKREYSDSTYKKPKALKGGAMNFTTLYSPEHKDILKKLDHRSGLYIIKNKKYPNFVKIGGAPDLKRRITTYKTYTPQYSDLELAAVAIKRSNRASKITGNKVGRDHWRTAEKRVLDGLSGKPDAKEGATEWRQVSEKKALDHLAMLHTYGTAEFPADGHDLPIYKFNKKSVKDLSVKKPRSVRAAKKKPVRKVQQYEPLKRGKRERLPTKYTKYKEYEK